MPDPDGRGAHETFQRLVVLQQVAQHEAACNQPVDQHAAQAAGHVQHTADGPGDHLVAFGDTADGAHLLAVGCREDVTRDAPHLG